jgi:hypothetical protein
MLYRLVISTEDCSLIDVIYTLEEHGQNSRELQQNIDIYDLLQMPTIQDQLTSLSFTKGDFIHDKQDMQTFKNPKTK